MTVAAHGTANKCEVIIDGPDDVSEIFSGPSEVRLSFMLQSGRTISVWATLDRETSRLGTAFFFVGRECEEPFTRFAGYYNPATHRGSLNPSPSQ